MKSCRICEKKHQKTGYCCSKECSSILRKRTNLEKYGVEHPLQSEEIKNKIKQTNLERYGVEHPLQSEEIKNKSKNMMNERYGGFTLQSDVLKEKVKQTCIEKYRS